MECPKHASKKKKRKSKSVSSLSTAGRLCSFLQIVSDSLGVMLSMPSGLSMATEELINNKMSCLPWFADDAS